MTESTPKKESNAKKPAENHDNDDLLDLLETRARFRCDEELVWEARPNNLLEKHPYICGYGFLITMAVLVFASNLSAFVISFLFLYLVSDFLTNDVRRYLKGVPKFILFSILYIALIALTAVLAYNVIPNFVRQLPGLANQLQVQSIEQFDYLNHRFNLTQYVDPQEVKSAIVKATGTVLRWIGGRLSSGYKGVIYFVFALVINLLLYHNIGKIDQVFGRKDKSIMGFFYRFTKTRISIFYFYFKRVMGGQIIISSINTVISSIVILALGLPHPILLIVIVFLFGLFPVVGNIASNTVLTVTAFVSTGTLAAVICLLLLVGIHKLEYFLNSKIIGEIVHLPMVITLTSLVVCEVLLGIVGLMLAIPIVLFLRQELEHIPGLASQKAQAIISPAKTANNKMK